MKQKDIVVLVAVAGVSALLAIAASKLVIRSSDKQQEVEVVQAITPDFPTPDERYFNARSIDPTQPISIGNSANPDPFRGAPGQ